MVRWSGTIWQRRKDDEKPNRAVKISRDNYRKESE